MIKVVNVTGFESQDITPTMLTTEDSIIFLVHKDNQDEEMYYSKIVKWNINTDKIDEWLFSDLVGIVSNQDRGKKVLYYASTKWGKNNVTLEFYKIDYSTFQNIHICSINLVEQNGTYIGDSEISHTELHGIDDRYCIVALPRMEPYPGMSLFSQLLLIDCCEKKIYEIPDGVGTVDLFTRLDQLYVEKSKGKTYLYLKTGRSTVNEKRNIFQHQEKNKNFKEYLAEKESIICIEIDLFIKKVKEGKDIGDESIVDSCMRESALSMLNSGGNIYYCKVDFARNRTEIIELLPGDNQKKLVLDGVHSRIQQVDGNYYLIEENDSKHDLIDLQNKKVIFSTASDERIVGGNSSFVITSKLGTKDIYYYNMVEPSFKKVGTGLPDFDPSNHILTIFNE